MGWNGLIGYHSAFGGQYIEIDSALQRKKTTLIMKMPSCQDVTEVINPFAETWGTYGRLRSARGESDRLALDQKNGAAQIGPKGCSKILEQRPTFRHADQARPDFTNRVRTLLHLFIGDHVAFTRLDEFPNEQTVEQQAKIIYERISAVLWGPGQNGRESGELLCIQSTLEEVLERNVRQTDDLNGPLINELRARLERDSQLHFLTREEADRQEAKHLMQLMQIQEWTREGGGGI